MRKRIVGQSNQNQILYLEISAILAHGKIAAVDNQIDKTMGRLRKRRKKKFTVRRRVRTMRRALWKDKRSARVNDHRQLVTTDAMGKRITKLMRRIRRAGRKLDEIVPKLARKKSKIWKMKLLAQLKGLIQRQEPRKSNKRSNNLKRL